MKVVSEVVEDGMLVRDVEDCRTSKEVAVGVGKRLEAEANVDGSKLSSEMLKARVLKEAVFEPLLYNCKKKTFPGYLSVARRSKDVAP